MSINTSDLIKFSEDNKDYFWMVYYFTILENATSSFQLIIKNIERESIKFSLALSLNKINNDPSYFYSIVFKFRRKDYEKLDFFLKKYPVPANELSPNVDTAIGYFVKNFHECIESKTFPDKENE